MKNIKNKILSIRINDFIDNFIDDFSKKNNLSRSETAMFMLKRSIGLFKYENKNKYDENSILNKALEVIDNNEKVSALDKKILVTVYRLLDLDIISYTKINDIVSKELSLNLINSLVEEELTEKDFLNHVEKMNTLMPNFFPYYLSEINQYFKHKILTKEKLKDTLFTISVNKENNI